MHQGRWHQLALNPNCNNHHGAGALITRPIQCVNIAQGQIARRRTKWPEIGGKNTKYFLNLETRHATKKAVLKLRNAKSITTDQNEIWLD